MSDGLQTFLTEWMSGTLGLFTSLFDGLPGSYDFVIWAVFVMMVMNLIIIPIRGAGMSDRALAKDVKSGRALSTKQINRGRAEAAAERRERTRYYRNKNRGRF